MIQTQILLTNIIRVVWETEKRITYEILGVKGLIGLVISAGNADEHSRKLFAKSVACSPIPDSLVLRVLQRLPPKFAIEI